MLRLLALSLLALAAPQAAAQQVHPCQAETPPCSLAMAQARHYLDELDRKAGNFVAPPDTPHAAAEQVHPCQAETPPCSLAMAQARHYLDELDRKAGNFVASPDAPSAVSPELAQTLRAKEKASRYLNDLWRETGPGTPAWEQAPAPPTPRYHVPYPLSRELLTGAVDPCDSAYASCPPELERIYNGLSRARHRDDQSLLKMYQRSLRYYYRTYQP